MGIHTSHMKVGNGDMTLITLDDGATLLIDINIRSDTDKYPDVVKQLKTRLSKNEDGHFYVDAFLLTHSDEDHCRGLKEYFHLGDPDSLNKDSDKIIIGEMWSSPMIFKHASKNNALCSDAKAWNTEARRRAKLFTKGKIADFGNKIKILGEDSDGKTDGLDEILVKQKATFTEICDRKGEFKALLIAPFPPSDDEEYTKNNSSVILNISFHIKDGPVRLLFGGDAGVIIWEKVCEEFSSSDLEYDALLAPHHCSWHSLSHDSWSEKGTSAEVSPEARKALSHACDGAYIISSSNAIKDDKNDPPCIGAKHEYENILKSKDGKFLCLGEEYSDNPVEFNIKKSGVVLALATTSSKAFSEEPIRHG